MSDYCQSKSLNQRILNKAEDLCQGVFSFLENHINWVVVSTFVLTLINRLYFIPRDLIIKNDGYLYLLKSLEITEGNFTPTLSHAIGWPLFMAPFFYFFKSDSIFQNMAYAKIISATVGALIIFPLAAIGKKLLDKKSLIFVLTLFMFDSQLIVNSCQGICEPSFILLFLSSLYYLIRLRDNINYVLLSALFGALAYYVRFNGIFLIGIIVLSLLLMKNEIHRFSYKYLLYAFLVFLIVSIPNLYPRMDTFGSPFNYGNVSKYFVDSYHQAWSNNIEAPSLIQYLKTHSFLDYTNKFIIFGFFKVIYQYAFYAINPLLLFFFFYGSFIMLGDMKKFMVLYVTLFIWIAGFSVPFEIFGVPRYLLPTIPLIFIFCGIGIRRLCEKISYQNVAMGGFLCIFMLFSLNTAFEDRYTLNNFYYVTQYENKEIAWPKWASENIEGKIAIYEGGDLIMMHLPEVHVAEAGLYEYYSSKLSVIHIPYAKDLVSTFKALKKLEVTHIAVDEGGLALRFRPILKELMDKEIKDEIPEYLIKIYDNYNDPHESWKIRFYRIDWDKFEELYPF